MTKFSNVPAKDAKTATGYSKLFPYSKEGCDMEIKYPKKTEDDYFPARYQLTFWSSFGLFVMYCLRVNLSVTLLAMVKPEHLQNASSSSGPCHLKSQNHSIKVKSALIQLGGDFEWDQLTQGEIQGSYFYGYTISHLLGALLVTKYGGKNLMSAGIISASILTLCIPFAASVGAWAMALTRGLVGLAVGMVVPAVYILTSVWIPVQERATQLSLIFMGMQMGTIFMLPYSAWLCQLKIYHAWALVFYTSGILGFIWWLGWRRYVYDSPECHPYISFGELAFIQDNVETTYMASKTRSVPWGSILRTRAVWVAMLTTFASNWTFYTMLTELPNYLQHILRYSTLENGFENALIFLVQSVVSIFAAYLSDMITTSKIYTRSQVRITFETLGLSLTACCLMTLPFASCDGELPASLIILLSQAFLGLTSGGESPLPIDLSPDWSGPVSGLINGFGSMAGIAAPAFVGWLINDHDTPDRWNIVFFSAGGVGLVGNLVFVLGGSAETQPWGVLAPQEE